MTTETESYFGRCRCCLTYGYVKNMWTQYENEGETEFFGEMLVNCFSLAWDSSGQPFEEDRICEDCIRRLRDAHSFKQMVLESQNQILDNLEDKPLLNEDKVSQQIEEDSYLMVHACSDSENDIKNVDNISNANFDVKHINEDSQNMEVIEFKDEEEYQEIEYLEDVDIAKDADDAKEDEKPVRKTKWPKKLPKADRFKTYKQYSIEDMDKAIEAANEGMAVREAANLYKIPLKTLASKLRNKDFNKTPSQIKTLNLIKDIKVILTYTNATPYKTKTTRYYCAYCGTDGSPFEEPEDLRVHTRSQHAVERIQKVEFFMKPYFYNEILKVDVENLLCNVCCLPITSWNEMFRHLRDKHNTVLDQAYTRVVPYLLQAQPKCALCKETFPNYLHLDVHMNKHYTNYMCGECGDSFVTNCRLKCHEKSHEKGRFPCSYCDKVFPMDKYKRKHEENVHKRISKAKCHYCDKKFVGDYERHNHVLKEHSEKVKVITCEICGRTFTMKARYTRHMSVDHKRPTKRYGCAICDQTFSLKTQLYQHKATHKNAKYYCVKCDNKFESQLAFGRHMKQHESESAETSK